MGRKRSKHFDLPPRMRRRELKNCVRYYYDGGIQDGKRKWIPLGSDFHSAMEQYAEVADCSLVAAYTDKWRTEIYERTRRNAIQRKIPFKLTQDDVDQLIQRNGNCCAVTGIPFSLKKIKGEKNPWAPSVDRIDSNLGYSFTNCRVVCLAVNYALNQWGTDVLLRIAEAIRDHAAPEDSRGDCRPKRGSVSIVDERPQKEVA